MPQLAGGAFQQLDGAVEVARAQLVRAFVDQRLGIGDLLPPIRDRLLVRGALRGRPVEVNQRSSRFHAGPAPCRGALLDEPKEPLRVLRTTGIAQVPGRPKHLRGVIVDRQSVVAVDLVGQEFELPVRFVHSPRPRQRPCVLRTNRCAAALRHLAKEIGGGTPLLLDVQQSYQRPGDLFAFRLQVAEIHQRRRRFSATIQPLLEKCFQTQKPAAVGALDAQSPFHQPKRGEQNGLTRILAAGDVLQDPGGRRAVQIVEGRDQIAPVLLDLFLRERFAAVESQQRGQGSDRLVAFRSGPLQPGHLFRGA